MPMYRNIHTKTPDSEDINDMPDDFTRLFYIMFFIILDSAGRGYDKPAWLKSKAFPLREDVTYEMINGAMDWFEKRGMIYRYEVNGKKCFWDPKFQSHQHGLNKEGKSVIPAPTPEQVKSWSGVTPEQVESNSAPKTYTNTTTKTNTRTDSDSKTGVVEPIENHPDLPSPEPDFFENLQEFESDKPTEAALLTRPQQTKIWNSALGEIQKEMPRADFEAYIRPLKLGNMVGNQLKVLAMNTPTRDWVRKRAGPQLQNALKGFAGFEIKLLIESDVQELERTKT